MLVEALSIHRYILAALKLGPRLLVTISLIVQVCPGRVAQRSGCFEEL